MGISGLSSDVGSWPVLVQPEDEPEHRRTASTWSIGAFMVPTAIGRTPLVVGQGAHAQTHCECPLRRRALG